MNESPTTPPSFAIIDDLDWWGLKSTVLRVALEFDIFTTIDTGHHTLEDIASTTKTSKRGMRVLLDALCPLGMLSKSQGAYFLTPTSEAFLVRGKPTFCADAYLSLLSDRDRLTECVRTGAASLDLPSPKSEDIWAQYMAPGLLTWPEQAETARRRWSELGITKETRPGMHVLDVACGSGVGSFVLAQADPTVQVTALDFPKVLAIATQIAEAMGVREQVTLFPGDLLTTEFPPEQYDVALLGAILYYFSPAQVKEVLRRAHHALKPGGLVVIRSLLADEERCKAETALMLAVELLHDAPDGGVYTFSEYKAFLEATGFANVTQHGDQLVSATK